MLGISHYLIWFAVQEIDIAEFAHQYNMNKIFKTKWNAASNSWVACPETSRQSGRITRNKVASALIVGVLSTATSSALADAYWNGEHFINRIDSAFASPTEANTYNMLVDAGRTYSAAGLGSTITFHRVSGTTTFNYIGDLTARDGLGLLGIQFNPSIVNFEGNVRYTAIPQSRPSNYPRQGIIGVNDAAIARFKQNTTIDSTYALSGNEFQAANISGGIYHIGVLAGSSVNSGNDSANSGKYSSVTFNHLDLNLTDASTGHTLLGLVNPVGTFGLRAIQGAHNNNTGTGSAGYIEVQGDLKLNISADRAIGIYASGNRFNTGAADQTGLRGSLTPKVVLNNSSITLNPSDSTVTSTFQWDSHAIKLGKVRNAGEGAGILESRGALVIDTTHAVHGGGIKLLRNSQLIANSASSSTDIRTNGYALEIGGRDDMNSSGQYDHSASHGVIASFRNARFSTTGTSADPLSANGEARRDLIFVDQGQVGTQISFSGDQTDLTAHDDGYILNVSGNYTAPRYQYFANKYAADGSELGHDAYEGSSVTLNATDAGSMTGLVSKGSVKTQEGQILDASQTPTLNLNLSNNFVWNLRQKGSENTARFDTLTLSSGAKVNAAINAQGGNNFVLDGNVISNGGIISLDNAAHGQYNDVLTINGNYTGSNGASIRMNTLWNSSGDAHGANSASDVLRITGTASGDTKVVPVGANGQEMVIDGNVQQIEQIITSVPVIYVDVSDSNMAFTGTAKTSGISEVQLAKRTNANGVDEYFWTAKAYEPPVPVDPVDPAPPTNPETPGIDIYDPSVPGYVSMARVNMEQGYSTLGTLHERRGENQTLAWDECGTCGSEADGQTWARIYGERLEQDGKTRLNFESDMYGIQIGHDFRIQRDDDGNHALSGLYVAYNHARTDFEDRYRAENGVISPDKFTGKGESDALSVGATHTRYAANGSYLDLVGQLSYLHNKYQVRDGAEKSQNGWGLALSGEVGRPFALGEHQPHEAAWMIEPQAQLIYQHVRLSSFNDGVRHIDPNGQNGLRGRLGVRIAYNAEGKGYRTNTFYGVANLWHDFINPSKVNIGSSQLRETYAKSWAEVGLGIQLPVSKHGYLYADARYEHQFGNTKREGYRGTIGFKHTWH